MSNIFYKRFGRFEITFHFESYHQPTYKIVVSEPRQFSIWFNKYRFLVVWNAFDKLLYKIAMLRIKKKNIEEQLLELEIEEMETKMIKHE